MPEEARPLPMLEMLMLTVCFCFSASLYVDVTECSDGNIA